MTAIGLRAFFKNSLNGLVTISVDMTVSDQCCIAASNDNQIIGLITRNITYKEKVLIIPLYESIVRPHLEYCIHTWRPYRKKGIDTLDKNIEESNKDDSRTYRP